jgi:hypothetical protein
MLGRAHEPRDTIKTGRRPGLGTSAPGGPEFLGVAKGQGMDGPPHCLGWEQKAGSLQAAREAKGARYVATPDPQLQMRLTSYAGET